MTEEEIPSFIDDLIKLGCDPIAIGSDAYVIGDADLPEPLRSEIQEALVEVCDRYADRDKLLPQIVAYLHSIGRSYPPVTKH